MLQRSLLVTALDITSSDVTFTADATTDPSSPVPAKVTVTGLGLTSDTVITYDANGDISSTDDQETVTVTVGSEPPYDGAAIVDAVYDDTIDTLEIMLGDPDATDAVVGNIFVDSVALTIGAGVTFTPGDSTTDPSSPVPAKITVTGLGTAPSGVTYDGDGDISSTDDQETVTVTAGSQPQENVIVVTAGAGSGGGNKYFLDGVEAPLLTLTPGQTYKFDLSSDTLAAHPFYLSDTANGTHSSGSIFTGGVTNSQTDGTAAGQPGAHLTIVVDSNTPDLYYFCEVHYQNGGMGNGLVVQQSSQPFIQPQLNYNQSPTEGYNHLRGAGWRVCDYRNELVWCRERSGGCGSIICQGRIRCCNACDSQ